MIRARSSRWKTVVEAEVVFGGAECLPALLLVSPRHLLVFLSFALFWLYVTENEFEPEWRR